MTTIESSAKVRKTYPQQWPAYNQAQTNEKACFLELLYELCKEIDEPIQTFGRPRLSFAEMIFAAAFKTYSTVSSRRFISDLIDAEQRGYITKTPHFNSISNYLELESMTPYLKQLISESSLPLKSVECDFAADSSGFATGQFSRWFDAKYGKEEQQRDWIEVHVMCDVKTNIVTSVEVSGRHTNDGPYCACTKSRPFEALFVQSLAKA